MEEKRKSIRWEAVVAVILSVLLIFFIYRTYKLAEQAQNQNNEINRLNSELYNMKNTIASIYANVDEKLKKEASLVSSADCSLGELTENNTALTARFSVVPKVITDDMQLFVTIDGKTFELKRDGNAFKGTGTVGMFVDSYDYPLLTIKTATETKTEFFEDMVIGNLYQMVLPSVSGNISGNSREQGGKTHFNMQLSVYVSKFESEYSDNKLTSVAIVEEIDGKQVDKWDITDKMQDDNLSYDFEYKKSFDASAGDTLKVYVVAEDSLGYIHKACILSSYLNNHDGEFSGDYEECIYDKSGNLLTKFTK